MHAGDTNFSLASSYSTIFFFGCVFGGGNDNDDDDDDDSQQPTFLNRMYTIINVNKTL